MGFIIGQGSFILGPLTSISHLKGFILRVRVSYWDLIRGWRAKGFQDETDGFILGRIYLGQSGRDLIEAG